MILTTHMLSYLSLTLPSLSLDLHSFDYSFLSHFCPFLLSLLHSLCHHSIFTYDVLSLELLSVSAQFYGLFKTKQKLLFLLFNSLYTQFPLLRLHKLQIT